jgi:hypothetical protein
MVIDTCQDIPVKLSKVSQHFVFTFRLKCHREARALRAVAIFLMETEIATTGKYKCAGLAMTVS